MSSGLHSTRFTICPGSTACNTTLPLAGPSLHASASGLAGRGPRAPMRTVASTPCVRVETTDSCSQNESTAHVWPDLSPPTVLLTPALVGAGSFAVQVRAPAI